MRYGALKTRLKRLQPLAPQETHFFDTPEEAEAFEKKRINERGEAGLKDVLVFILPARTA